jgi:hypothetical protein
VGAAAAAGGRCAGALRRLVAGPAPQGAQGAVPAVHLGGQSLGLVPPGVERVGALGGGAQRERAVRAAAAQRRRAPRLAHVLADAARAGHAAAADLRDAEQEAR